MTLIGIAEPAHIHDLEAAHVAVGALKDAIDAGAAHEANYEKVSTERTKHAEAISKLVNERLNR